MMSRYKSETFRRRDVAGRRCLNCGHERITEDSRLDYSVASWSTNTTDRQF
jgi:hypothetical protein